MSRRNSSKIQKEGSEHVQVPDIPESAVKLKVDHYSGNIRIDEEALLRTLQKVRMYIKASSDSVLSTLRSELDSSIVTAKREVMVNVQEVVAELDSDVKASRDVHEERLRSLESEFATLKGKMETGSHAKSPRKAAIPEEEEAPKQKRAFVRSQTMAVGLPMESHSSDPGDRNLSRSQTSGAEIHMESVKSEPAIGSSTRVDSDDEAIEQKGDDNPTPKQEYTSESADLGKFRETFQALQTQLSDGTAMMRRLETKLEGDVVELSAKLDAATTDRRTLSAKLVPLEKKVEILEVETRNSSNALQELEKKAVQEEKIRLVKESIHDLQEQVNELNVQVAQAAVAEVVSSRIDSMSQKLEMVADSCQKADAERATVAESISTLQVEVKSCSTQLNHTASHAEMDSRFQHLDQQSRGVTDLMMDVQSTLGDISTAVVALGSKAEKADLAVMRGELSTIAEGIKEREQTVLFGARCLSCNRVFDDVQTNCGTVDLPGERQRDALFAEVQRALHSPKMDPTAKIKMLAVKVGRPMSVPSAAGGNFAGRDPASFACGVGDVQLVPVRGNAIAHEDVRPIPLKPEGTPRILKRRFKGGEATWQGGAKEGPMDFKHPLSHLVDRSNRGITIVN